MKNIFKFNFVSSFVFLAIFAFLFLGNVFVNQALAEDEIIDEEVVEETPEEEEIVDPDPEPEPEPEEIIEEVETFLIEGNITLKNGCTITDTDEATHVFPNEDSPSEYLGICALEEARELEVIESFGLVNDPSFGLYVESVNGIEPSSTEFWSLWHNGGFAECGISCLALAAGDTLSLILTDWMTDAQGATITLSITELGTLPEDEEEEQIEEEDVTLEDETPEEEAPEQSSNSVSGSSPAPSPEFDVSEALSFLSSQQNSDGSFSNTLISDWAAVAFSASDSHSSAKTKLYNYLLTAPDAGSEITDYERRAMALLALDINPYSGTPTDYITPIINSFDGTQIGESFPHDDIFAIFPLLHAGYDENDEIIQKITAYIVQTQNGNGSWGDPDSTAAAIQALSLVDSEPGVSDAIANAKTYLKGAQRSNGGFGNSFSTSWVLQAIVALGESATDWSINGNMPMDYLAELQESDGGVDRISISMDFRTWATSYAIVAASGKTWSEIMESFSKPAGENNQNSSGYSSNSDTMREATDTQTPPPPAEPVVCPTGDLSITTGEPCAEFIAPVSPKVTVTPVPTVVGTTVARILPTTETENENKAAEEIENIENENLTATAIDALPLPSEKTSPYTAPIVLATISGLALLYVAFKFLIV